MTRRRSGSRGVTPVGAAAFALVFGVGASCLWWAQSASAAREDETQSRTEAAQIAEAAGSFRAEHSDGCPTITELKEARFLSDSTREDDAWGNRFRIRCEDERISVGSAGPDRRANTPDDVRVTR